MKIDFENLENCSLFCGLNSEEMKKVVRLFYERHFAVGERLFSQGEEGDAFYFLHQGQVRISRQIDKEMITIAQLSEGSVLGEMALISNEARTADATAIESSVLWELTSRRFMSLSRLEPEIYKKIALNLSKILCARLDEATLRVSKVLDVLIEAETARSSLKERLEKSKKGLRGFLQSLGVGGKD